MSHLRKLVTLNSLSRSFGNILDRLHSVSPLSKGGNPNFENFKKGGPEKIILGRGNQKGGFSK